MKNAFIEVQKAKISCSYLKMNIAFKSCQVFRIVPKTKETILS